MSDQLTKSELYKCSNCDSEDVDVEVYANGIVPARKEGTRWVADDSPALYVEWDYGQAVCAGCGKVIYE